MKLATRLQLSVMMFLEFFIWGAWFVTMGTYLSTTLQASDVQNGLAYGTQSLGAIIAPFIIGLIADKFFPAQKILGFLHLAGAAFMYYISTVDNFASFYPSLLVYMILYMPTLALVNSVSFKQLTNPEKEFSGIRVWGTIGWIVAGLIIGWLAWEQKGSLVNTFRLTAIISAILGVFSFTLPNTPPPKAGTKVTVSEILGLDALSLLKDKSFLMFFLSSLLICIPLAFYYQETNKFLNELRLSGAAGKMSMGQMSEMIFMILMPLFFRKLGVKKMLLLGMIAWAVRYLMFGFGNTGSGVWLLYIGIVLHGICYDFFFVTGQIYTDERAGEKIRSSAQGMITLATYGTGMLIGFWFAGIISNKYELADQGAKYAGIKKGDIVIKVNNATFTDNKDFEAKINTAKAGEAVKISYLRNSVEASTDVKLKEFPAIYTEVVSADAYEKVGIETDKDSKNVKSGELVVKSTTSTHFWKNIWMVPAGIAVVVTLLFLVFFKDPKKTKEA